MPKLIKSLLTFALLTALAGCLPKSEVIIPTVRRTLVVDLRPGREVEEETTQEVSRLLRQELESLPALEARTVNDLTTAAGGTLRLPEETSNVLVTSSELDALDTQLYLIGTLSNLSVELEESNSPGERMGFHRDLAVADISLRLYLSTTGELLAMVSTTHEEFQVGESDQSSVEFQETLAGRAVMGAIEKLIKKLTSTINASPWNGFVSEATEDSLLLPLGYEVGVQSGDVFIIYSPSEAPGERGTRRGSVVIETTGSAESYALPLSGGSFAEGDLALQQQP